MVVSACHWPVSKTSDRPSSGNGGTRLIQADGEEVIRMLVSLGKGMSLMRIDEAIREAACGNLAICDLGLDLHVDLFYAYAKSRAKDPALKALFEAVKRVWGVDKADQRAA